MLSEPERLAYLESLGITQYIATVSMPQGLTLPDYEWPEVESAVEPSSATVSHRQDSPTANAQQNSVTNSVNERDFAHQLSALTKQMEHPASAKDLSPDVHSGQEDHPPPNADIAALDLGRLNKGLSAPSRPKPALANQSQLKFALQVVATPRCRLVFELSLADSPGLSSLETQWVSDLLLALGLDRELSQYRTKLFRWPLVDNPMIAADQDAAKDALISFLAGDHLHEKTVFLGRLAPQVLDMVDCGVPFTVAGHEGVCLWTHSLATLQKQWRLKAEAWTHLCSFLDNA